MGSISKKDMDKVSGGVDTLISDAHQRAISRAGGVGNPIGSGLNFSPVNIDASAGSLNAGSGSFNMSPNVNITIRENATTSDTTYYKKTDRTIFPV